ncbi:MAG: unsaturated rhamnogalacturonyl hydrolase [Flavobacteriales bacterium]|jgi:unsaturated rhamnogalacturonyl hydrolase
MPKIKPYLYISISCLLALCLSQISCTSKTAKNINDKNKSNIVTQSALLGDNVATWQLNHLSNFDYIRTFREDTANEKDWIQAAFWIGANRWAEKRGDKNVTKRIFEHATRNAYSYGHRTFHADEHAIGQSYLWAHKNSGNVEILKPTIQLFDSILAVKPDNDLTFIASADPGFEGTCQARWCWADALFMAPRTWLLLSNATGDKKYFDYANEEFWDTSDYLFDKKLGLFYRDSRYFNSKSKNGNPVFWSRGNGWVFAGLALIIDDLDQNQPARPKYIELYTSMARSLIKLQRKDGYWPASLMDPSVVTTPETSGTAFITFGLAWGVNEGILESNEVIESVELGWSAIHDAVTTDGMVEWVQQVGKAPDPVEKTDTQLYGVGAVLLAASEMLRWKY